MRIGLQTWGTEGDIRPFISLASELQKRGHEVRLITSNVDGRDLTSLGKSAGVKIEQLSVDYFRNAQTKIAEGARANFRTKDPVKQLDRILTDTLDPVVMEMYEAACELASWSTFMVVHSLTHPAIAAAQVAKKPYGCVTFAPMFRTREYPPMGAPNLGRLLNPMLWTVAGYAFNSVALKRVNVVRERAGLTLAKDMVDLVAKARLSLLAVSPTVLPRPTDWVPMMQVCGYLELPESSGPSALDPGLQDFLKNGEPPAFFTSGSMGGLEPEQAHANALAMVEAAKSKGLRVLLQVPDSLRDSIKSQSDVYVLSRAPHAQVFPQCAVVVHHGGAGTTHSVLQSGTPSIVVPHAVDQFFWGDLLYRRGVAAKPIDGSIATAKGLSARLESVLRSPTMRQRGQQLAQQIREENGPATACQLIEEMFRTVSI